MSLARSRLILLASITLVTPLFPQTVPGYTAMLKTETVGVRPDRVTAAEITATESAVRVDYSNQGKRTSTVIQHLDGRHLVINHRNKTFYWASLPMGAGTTMRLMQPPWNITPNASVKLQSMHFNNDIASEEIEGFATSTSRLSLVFNIRDRIGKEPVAAKVVAQLDLWRTSLDPRLYAINPHTLTTGFPEIDQRIREALINQSLTVIKSRLEVTRSIDGAHPSTSVITTSLNNVQHKSEVAADLFEVPDGYSLEPPKYLMPQL